MEYLVGMVVSVVDEREIGQPFDELVLEGSAVEGEGLGWLVVGWGGGVCGGRGAGGCTVGGCR